MTVGCLGCLGGCDAYKWSDDTSHDAKFVDAYERMALSVGGPGPSVLADSRRVTLTASQITVADFLRVACQQTGVSVICEDGVDAKKVDVQCTDTPILEVLQAVARRVGSELTRVGSIYFIGSIKAEDKGVLCRRASRLLGKDLQSCVTVLLSDVGKVQAFDDGLVVVGDKVSVLQHVSELIDKIEQAGADSWVVQLNLVQRADNKTHDIGGDVTPAADLAYTFAAASGNQAAATPAAGATGAAATPAASVVQNGVTGVGSASLSGAFRAVLTRDRKRAFLSPLLVVADGASATYHDGQQIPIASKSVSQYGVVQTTGFTFLPVGTSVNITVRQVADGTASLTLKVNLATFDGYDPTSGGPISSSTELDTVANVASGGIYLLGSFGGDSTEDTQGAFFSLRSTGNSQHTGFQVWARVYKVSGGVRKEYRGLAAKLPSTMPVPIAQAAVVKPTTAQPVLVVPAARPVVPVTRPVRPATIPSGVVKTFTPAAAPSDPAAGAPHHDWTVEKGSPLPTIKK